MDILLVKGPIVCSSSFLISIGEGYLDHNRCLFNIKSVSKEIKKEVNVKFLFCTPTKIVKFMFSKKATKIDEIFTIDLTLCSKC